MQRTLKQRRNLDPEQQRLVEEIGVKWIETCAKEDSGVFHLLCHDGGNEDDPICIASVGMDHVHIGDVKPINVGFCSKIRLCFLVLFS